MNIKRWIPFSKRIFFKSMSKDFLLPHILFFFGELSKMAVALQTIQPMRLCVRDIQSPVGNMYFQSEASIHTYGAFVFCYRITVRDIFRSISVEI